MVIMNAYMDWGEMSWGGVGEEGVYKGMSSFTVAINVDATNVFVCAIGEEM